MQKKLIKLVLICLLCIAIVSGIVYLITQLK
jgi:hypothetical protein